jgi:hypothetical protein
MDTEPVWAFLEKIKSLAPVGIRTPNHPASADEFVSEKFSFFFTALNQNLANHEFKGDRRVKHDCDTVDVTHETVWHQQGTQNFVPR